MLAPPCAIEVVPIGDPVLVNGGASGRRCNHRTGLCRPRPSRHQPGPPRTTRGIGRLPGWRPPRCHQPRSPGAQGSPARSAAQAQRPPGGAFRVARLCPQVRSRGVAELFGVAHSTVYRTIQRERDRAQASRAVGQGQLKGAPDRRSRRTQSWGRPDVRLAHGAAAPPGSLGRLG